jgi:hypothetical protein
MPKTLLRAPSKDSRLILSRYSMNLHEALELSTELGLRMATVREANMALKSGERLDGARTATFVVQADVDKPFGVQVASAGLTYLVPREYWTSVNTMLVLQHPEIEIDKSSGIVRGEVKKILLRPTVDGPYETDPATGLPNGIESPSDNPNAIHWYGVGAPGIFSVVSDFAGKRTLGARYGPEQNFKVVLVGEAHTVVDPKLARMLR